MPTDWVAFLREFGLPITMLVVLGVAFGRGIFVTGASSNARIKDIQQSSAEAVALAEKEKTYREERRLEERASRLRAEEALSNQVTVMRDMTELLKDIERNLRGPG